MTHDIRELNRYTGMFSAGCFFASIFCVYGLQEIGKVLIRFHEDYRRVNSVNERERSENEMS